MISKSNNPEYIVFDAKGEILGRLATKIAKTLSGKNRVDFQPNVGGSDWAIVINSDKVRLSGAKAKNKIYHKHSGYPGGITSITFEHLLEKDFCRFDLESLTDNFTGRLGEILHVP